MADTRYSRNDSEFCSVTEIRITRSHTIQLHLCVILEKAKLHRHDQKAGGSVVVRGWKSWQDMTTDRLPREFEGLMIAKT